jgi:hypothetical protein
MHMNNKKATTTWQRELRNNPKLVELNRRLAAKKRALKDDKEFNIETEKLRIAFERGFARHPKHLRALLHHFSNPVGSRLSELNDFLDSIGNAKLRKLFEKYLKYVARFGVVARLKKGKAGLTFEYMVPWGMNLHVRLVNGHFEPGKGHPGGNTPSEYFFESNSVPKSPNLRRKLKAADAKVVVIDDENWSSVLTKMEYIAYDPERLTFILHDAEQPYLFCLVGEKATNKSWNKASTVVSAFLRENFNRGKAGRRMNLRRFQEMIRLRRKAGPIKERLVAKGELEKHSLSERSYSARIGKHVRDAATITS